MRKNSEILGVTPGGAISNHFDLNYKNCFVVLRTSTKLRYNKTYVVSKCNIVGRNNVLFAIDFKP